MSGKSRHETNVPKIKNVRQGEHCAAERYQPEEEEPERRHRRRICDHACFDRDRGRRRCPEYYQRGCGRVQQGVFSNEQVRQISCEGAGARGRLLCQIRLDSGSESSRACFIENAEQLAALMSCLLPL